AGYRFASVNRSDFDVVQALRRSIDDNRLAQSVAEAEPSLAIYHRLKAALARYRELAQADLSPLPPLPPRAHKIEPGGKYAGVSALAARLRLFGDLPPDAALPDGDAYDGAVVDAVRAFQRRHGLTPDGVLGKSTFIQLNTPLQHRVRQIELAMERLRWVPRLPAGRIIAVNIPSFT